MLKKAILVILVVTVAAVAAFAVVVAFQPDDFTVTRTASINAPAEKVFEQINDFHKWEAWSPWVKIDPTMKTTYSGPASGPGASYAWVGNSDVGEGKMTILESHPPSHIKIDLEFISPFAAKNITEFKVAANGDKSNITWTMSGKNNFLMKAFSLLVNMDKVVGADFDKGLEQLRTVVESSK